MAAEKVHEDDQTIAFKDINPQAPVHLLVIPKRHISTVNDIQGEDLALIGYMVQVARDLAKQNNISESGYRLIMNCNSEGGQTVFHMHLHLLGGRQLTRLG